MTITNAIASIAINDQKQAVKWYEKIFSRPPDSTPNSDLAEWQFEQGGSLQVYRLATGLSIERTRRQGFVYVGG